MITIIRYHYSNLHVAMVILQYPPGDFQKLHVGFDKSIRMIINTVPDHTIALEL
jgi:hypothetical protein